MKNLFLCISSAMLLASCINSSTAWTNRSISYISTPEMIGEHSTVSGSPTSNDASVAADKTFESAAKTNIAQNLSDTSTNDQSKKAAEEAPKAEEKSDK